MSLPWKSWKINVRKLKWKAVWKLEYFPSNHCLKSLCTLVKDEWHSYLESWMNQDIIEPRPRRRQKGHENCVIISLKARGYSLAFSLCKEVALREQRSLYKRPFAKATADDQSPSLCGQKPSDFDLVLFKRLAFISKQEGFPRVLVQSWLPNILSLTLTRTP